MGGGAEVMKIEARDGYTGMAILLLILYTSEKRKNVYVLIIFHTNLQNCSFRILSLPFEIVLDF